jgi:hypothetical protein
MSCVVCELRIQKKEVTDSDDDEECFLRTRVNKFVRRALLKFAGTFPLTNPIFYNINHFIDAFKEFFYSENRKPLSNRVRKTLIDLFCLCSLHRARPEVRSDPSLALSVSLSPQYQSAILEH